MEPDIRENRLHVSRIPNPSSVDERVVARQDRGMSAPKFRQLRLDALNLPQPALRSERRKLDELVASIEAVGVLVPLVVRKLGKEYAVVAGAGRLEALRVTGAGPATKVPCVVVDVDDAEATLLS
jgi:ParB-like chromosome segregation protein Spo0J